MPSIVIPANDHYTFQKQDLFSYAGAHNAAAADSIIQQPPPPTVMGLSNNPGWNIARGEIFFPATFVPGNIVSMVLRMWLQQPPGGTETDPLATTVFIVQGANTVPPLLTDYGLLGSHNVVANTGVIYPLVVLAGSYFDIPLNSNAISWFVSGSVFCLGVRVKGDIDATVPTGDNDIDLFTSWSHLNALENSSLTITYAAQTGNAIKKKLFATGAI
jgi:hypothetical protein